MDVKKLWENLRGMKGWPLLLAGLLAGLICLAAPLQQQQQGNLTQEESRISGMLSLITGAGDTRVLLHYAGEDSLLGSQRKPEGALILSRGADNPAVRLQLLQAVETLLGLPQERVEIFLMEGP